MSTPRMMLLALLAIVSVECFASNCEAQNTFRRRRPLRWLGQGFSDGYHRHNPGHDTSYYNPYNRHNSYLLSQSPEYLAVTQQFAGLDTPYAPARFFSGVPFSIYAAPPQKNFSPLSGPIQQIESSLTPAKSDSIFDADSGTDNADDFNAGSGSRLDESNDLDAGSQKKDSANPDDFDFDSILDDDTSSGSGSRNDPLLPEDADTDIGELDDLDF